MLKITRLNDVFTDWIPNGIFKFLNALDVPWKNVPTITTQELDIAYHGARSGQKIVSSLVDNLITDNTLSDDNKQNIAMAIFAKYSTNWEKLWSTMSVEYNPIENYSMTETETESDKHAGTNSFDGSDISVNSENTVQNTQNNNQLYGFNSTDPVNADKSMGDNIQDVSGNTNRTTKNSGTENLNIDRDRTLKRSGNIGVTTSQQMLQSERDLWVWNFFDTVFRDVDTFLTIQIY